MKAKGYNVDAIEPQAAMYLTVKLDLAGSKTANGTVLETNHQVHRYILDEAQVGLVPFSYFGASESSPWYRLSVGTAKLEDVESVITNLDGALGKLQ
ncbi:MAG: aminotransferase class I/II-fold pyridoxal phosphate-dependent enzyme [Calditrichota bacterium]